MATAWSSFDRQAMRRAIELARQGEGYVEPNPMVGCVITRGQQIVAEGWHRAFGEAHAEVAALRNLRSPAGECHMYVTLEPCCHEGKTPPCCRAILQAGIPTVTVAVVDPFSQVSGRGIQQLRDAGVAVRVGLEEAAAAALIAPFRLRQEQQRPWVIAKWAMSCDGKIATGSGHSRWISNTASRAVAHRLRGRVDAILVGLGTCLADDPLLTARPPGPRVATRVVLDDRLELPQDGQLVRTAVETPLMVATTAPAAAGPSGPETIASLQEKGVEVLVCEGADRRGRLEFLLRDLAKRGMTNVLVEGGGQVLGSFRDADWIDEIHVFIAPRLIGGNQAPSPLGGLGAHEVPVGQRLDLQMSRLEGDLYLQGRVLRDPDRPLPGDVPQ